MRTIWHDLAEAELEDWERGELGRSGQPWQYRFTALILLFLLPPARLLPTPPPFSPSTECELSDNDCQAVNWAPETQSFKRYSLPSGAAWSFWFLAVCACFVFNIFLLSKPVWLSG